MRFSNQILHCRVGAECVRVSTELLHSGDGDETTTSGP